MYKQGGYNMIQPLTIGSPLPTTSHSQNGSFRHDSQGSPKPAQLEIPTARGRKKERKHAALLALSVACLLAEGTISCHPPLSKHLAAARAAQVIQLQPEPGQPKESSESWEEWRDRPEVGGGSRDSGKHQSPPWGYQTTWPIFLNRNLLRGKP